MIVANIIPAFSFFSLADFNPLMELLGGVEECSESIDIKVVVPDDVLACKQGQDLYTAILSRYSKFLNLLPVAAGELGPLVSEQGLDVFEIGLIRRLFAVEQSHIGVVRRGDVALGYAHLRVGERLIRVPMVGVPFDAAKVKELVSVWKAHDLAASRCLVLVGYDDVSQVALDLSVEFGFDDADSLLADGAPSKFWRKRATAKFKNPKNFCIATSRLGHAHTQGFSIRFAGCSTHAALSDVIFEELRKLAEGSP